MSENNKFYLTRDGKPSPYMCTLFKDETNLNVIIVILKNLDYPFSADEWYGYVDLQKPNPLGKYINLMNIGNFKPLKFEDSKLLNMTSRNLKRLYKEINNTLYFEVTDKAPELAIEIEEIKSNTFKKPKYFIGYDKDNNPLVKFENIKDMNMSFDCDTTECRNSSGAIVGQYTLNKELKIHFTCEEAIFSPIENKEEPKYIVKNETSIEIPKTKETDYESEIDKFIKELNL